MINQVTVREFLLSQHKQACIKAYKAMIRSKCVRYVCYRDKQVFVTGQPQADVHVLQVYHPDPDRQCNMRQSLPKLTLADI